MNISYSGPVENSRQRVLNQVGQWKQENPNFRVIDVGGNSAGWSAPIADMIVDINSKNTDKSISLDICRLNEWSKLIDDVNINGKYDYAICTHTLEDVYNPFSTLECLPKISNAGIISMPSITTELSRLENADWLGFIHHRWIFDQQDGVMVVMPKISFLEKLLGNGVNRNIDRDEIVYDWQGSIDYKIFMNNYLGPNVATVIREYKQFITERI